MMPLGIELHEIMGAVEMLFNYCLGCCGAGVCGQWVC